MYAINLLKYSERFELPLNLTIKYIISNVKTYKIQEHLFSCTYQNKHVRKSWPYENTYHVSFYVNVHCQKDIWISAFIDNTIFSVFSALHHIRVMIFLLFWLVCTKCHVICFDQSITLPDKMAPKYIKRFNCFDFISINFWYYLVTDILCFIVVYDYISKALKTNTTDNFHDAMQMRTKT